MDRSFARSLESYKATSSAWLIDTMRTSELAVAAAKIVDARAIAYASNPKLEDCPMLAIHSTSAQGAIPAGLWTGAEFQRAVFLINDHTPPRAT